MKDGEWERGNGERWVGLTQTIAPLSNSSFAASQSIRYFGRDGEPRERLVVLHKDHRRVIDRIPEYGRAFEHLGLAAQVLPWTRAELATRLAEREPFATEIVRTGKVLAGTLDRLGDAERGKGEG